jgi:PAS domain S-box-containing protein
MHRILERQLERTGTELLPVEHPELFERISQAYNDYDAERSLIERSLEVSSRELAEAITLLKSTINSVDEGILVFNKRGEVVNVNERFKDIWQVSDSALHAKSAVDGINVLTARADDPIEFARIFTVDSLLTGKKTEPTTIKLKDGKFLEVYSTPHIVKGNKNGTVCIFRDITDRYLFEEELRKKIDAMERLNRVMVGRELRMIELKKEIKSLKDELGVTQSTGRETI